MSISAVAKTLAFDRRTMWVELEDGRSLGVPLAWFPHLSRATPEQLTNYRIGYSGNGLHWDDIDEGISVEGLLAGRGRTAGRNGWRCDAEKAKWCGGYENDQSQF